MLLFLDQADDLHADWVEAECDRRMVKYLRFCVEAFPRDVSLSIEMKKDAFHGKLLSANQVIPFDSITGIWMRRPGKMQFDPDMDPELKEFATKEAYYSLYGMYETLADRRWVNHPERELQTEYKLLQLKRAQMLGLQIPPTLVTNNPDDVWQFFHDVCGGEMIYKRLWSDSFVSHDEQRGIYTTQIDEDSLVESLDGVRLTPCLFQCRIPKQYEIRVNVIGEYVWAAAIYSQEVPDAQLDFRPYADECRIEPIILPDKIANLCRSMTHGFGLRMANIDLIVMPDGEYVFLEINSNGQWAWIEDRTGLPLATALVDELLGVDTLNKHPYISQQSLAFEPNTAIKQRELSELERAV